MSYFYFDHNISTKDRYSRALNQWHLAQPDEDHMASTGSTYIKWMQEELGHQSNESKMPRTEESAINDHIKRLRATLNQ